MMVYAQENIPLLEEKEHFDFMLQAISLDFLLSINNIPWKLFLL